MILNQYKSNHLLVNVNFLEESSEAGLLGYRGDLVLIDGGLDDKGHPNPPKEVMRGAVILADEKIHMLIGGIDRVDQISTLFDKFGADLADDVAVMLFVVNAGKSAIYEVNGVSVVIIPLVQGVPWNEAMEELALEKSDFKGQSPADKLCTLYSELKSYKSKAPAMALEEMLAATVDVKREVWGAV